MMDLAKFQFYNYFLFKKLYNFYFIFGDVEDALGPFYIWLRDIKSAREGGEIGGFVGGVWPIY
jgi:hypothetical protein